VRSWSRCALACTHSSTYIYSLFLLLVYYLAWRTSFPLDDCANAALLSSFDRSGREGASPRRTRNTYLFKIRQSWGAHRFLHEASHPGCTSLDFPDICTWPSHASRGRGARHCLCSVAWRLGLGTAGDDALVDTSKLFVLGTET